MFGKGSGFWYNKNMTGRTRDYLADLANRKGVSLPNEQERDQAWASRKIDELNALPDATFTVYSKEQEQELNQFVQKQIDKVLRSMKAWTFQG